MNRPHKTEHETQEKNGLAREFGTHTSSRSNTSLASRQDLQGYALIAASLLLLTYASGYFETLHRILSIALGVGSLGLLFYGAKKANLIHKAQDLIERLRKGK